MTTFRIDPTMPSRVVTVALTRDSRLTRLQQATDAYTEVELGRIDEEVAALEAITKARRAGQGAAEDAVGPATAIAEADIDAYLRGV